MTTTDQRIVNREPYDGGGAMALYLRIIVALVVLVATACTKPNPVVCCTSAADCSSLGLNEPNRACQDGFVCVEHECEIATGPCLVDDQCAEPTPFCDPGIACVACLDDAQCSGERPTCDDQTRSCRACVDDGDCDSSLCDISTGMCVPENEIVFASPSGHDSGTCEKASPCSIAHANATVDSVRNKIKLAPGAYTATVPVIGKTLIVHGVGATVTGASAPAFTVENGGRLRLVGLTAISQIGGGSTIRCEGGTNGTPTLELFRTTVDASGTAIIGNPCMLDVEQSVVRVRTANNVLILFNYSVAHIDRTFFDGGSTMQPLEATVHFTNSIFKRVGRNDLHGMIQGLGPVDISFSTIIDTFIECGGQGATGLTVNSSILHYSATGAPSDVVQGSGCPVTYSVVYPQSQPLGTTTNAHQLPRLKDVATDDFHLLSNSPALDRGDPAATTAFDYDGIARPQGGGRDSGAFEFVP
jgi:hypothetical protein